MTKGKNKMAFRTLDDLDVKGKRVLVRADLNVPVAEGKVTDATRIERQAPTIRELADKGAKVVVADVSEAEADPFAAVNGLDERSPCAREPDWPNDQPASCRP